MLLDILEYLPRTSAYAQALATDQETAEQAAQLTAADQPAKWQRAHRDYSPEVEMLSALFDRLGELIRVTAAIHGGKGKPPQAAPRPVSAFERARKKAIIARHQSLVARVLPPSAGP